MMIEVFLFLFCFCFLVGEHRGERRVIRERISRVDIRIVGDRMLA